MYIFGKNLPSFTPLQPHESQWDWTGITEGSIHTPCGYSPWSQWDATSWDVPVRGLLWQRYSHINSHMHKKCFFRGKKFAWLIGELLFSLLSSEGGMSSPGGTSYSSLPPSFRKGFPQFLSSFHHRDGGFPWQKLWLLSSTSMNIPTKAPTTYTAERARWKSINLHVNYSIIMQLMGWLTC